MPSDEKYVVSLRRHVFRAPHPAISISITSGIILLFSYLVHPNIMNAFFLFFVPFILVILLDHVSVRCLRVYFPMSRIATLNLVVFLVSFFQFWILSFFFPFPFSFFLAFAYPVDFRYTIYRTFLAERRRFAAIISYFYNAVIFAISIFYLPSFPWLAYLLASAIYGIAGYLFLLGTTAIFRREYREDPLFFISSFINYMGKLGGEEESKLNRFFHAMYTDRVVPVSTMVFRSGERVKAVFVAPYVHPGPFGNVGGSNIPNKLEKSLGMNELMVFHTTTTHDNNIASDEDVEKIAEAVRKSIEESMAEDCKSDMSDMLRSRIDGVSVAVQRFGDYGIISLIPEKAQFDDVELETGLAIREVAMKRMKDAMVLDAHNCFDENSVPLSLTSGDVRSMEKLLNEITADKGMKMGFAAVSMEGRSIGPGGIRAAVFKYNGKRVAYILLDGNNIKRGLRNKIIESLEEVDEVEVFSTDNHIVNVTMMDLNPVGEKDDWDEIVRLCREAVRRAMENMEDVCVNMKTEFINLRMASAGNMAKITSVTKESMKRAKIIAPLVFGASFMGAFLIFYFLT